MTTAVRSPSSPSGGIAAVRAFAGDTWAVVWRSVALLLLVVPIAEPSGTPTERLGLLAVGVLLLALLALRASSLLTGALRGRAPVLPWRVPPRLTLALAGLGAFEALATLGLAESAALDPVGGVELEDPDLRDGLALLAFVLGPVAAAPLIEEIAFRGLLQGLLIAWARPPLAYAATASCFAIMHGTREIFWLYLASTIVWCHLARHRGVVATAVVHAAYNGVLIVGGLVLMLVMDPVLQPEELFTRWARSPTGAGLSAAAWVRSLALLWRLASPRHRLERPTTAAGLA